MASDPLVGGLLRALAASKPGGRFLDLGTGTGIATAWLLDGMDADSSLISVDTDSALQQVASESLGTDRRLTLSRCPGIPACGFYVIDDLLPQTNWPQGHAEKVPVLIDQLAGNTRFEIIPMQWASGVIVAVKSDNRSYA